MESPQVSHHAAWNKGKLVGQKAPLKLSFVRSSAHDERSTSCWGREGEEGESGFGYVRLALCPAPSRQRVVGSTG